MGMDVFGTNPKSEVGEYFRNNVWWWHPLADYCTKVAPAITSQCAAWHTNDGCGLDSTHAEVLAEVLEAELQSGRTLEYETVHTSRLASLPDELCTICDGTGKRLPPPNRGAGSMPCNGCGCEGKVKPFAAHYPFSEGNVKEFVAFLRDCGGFQIC